MTVHPRFMFAERVCAPSTAGDIAGRLNLEICTMIKKIAAIGITAALAFVPVIASAQDATPAASPMASPMAKPMHHTTHHHHSMKKSSKPMAKPMASPSPTDTPKS